MPERTSEVAVRRLLGLLGALLFVVLGADPAAATPVRLTGRLTDNSGVLDATDRTAIVDVLDEVANRTGIDPYVSFVPTFGSVSADDWVARTAEESHLGASALLLAVAVDGSPEYSWWLSDDSRIDANEVAAIVTKDVEPLLGSGDWVGAVRAAGQGLTSAGNAIEATPDPSPWSTATTVTIVGAVVLVLLTAHLLSRRRQAAVG